MGLVDEISDDGSLRAWLKTQPREVCNQIAHRAAMRVLPIYWDWASQQDDVKALPVLRASLISGVAAFVPTPLIRSAIYIATTTATTTAATATAATATATAAAAANAAAAVANAALATAGIDAANAAGATLSTADAAIDTDVLEIIRNEARRIEAGEPIADTRLWLDTKTPLDRFWSDTKARLQDGDPNWSFWINWYQGALDGTPLPEPLRVEIAAQDEDFWEGTDAEVNARIAEIWETDQERQSHDGTARSTTVSLGVIRQQISTLRTFLDDQHIALHGINDKGDEADEARINRQLTLLVTLIEATDKMLGACDDSTPGRALAVIADQLPVIFDGAEEIAETEKEPTVAPLLVSMSASIKMMTEAGTPGYAAFGSAAFVHVMQAIGSLFQKKK